MLLVIEGTQFGYFWYVIGYWRHTVWLFEAHSVLLDFRCWHICNLRKLQVIKGDSHSEQKQKKHAGGVKMMLATTIMMLMMMMMMMMIPEFPLWARIWLEPGPPWPHTAMKTCKTATKKHCKKIGIIKQGTLYKIRVWRMFRSHLKLELGSLGHTNALRPLSDWGTCSSWSSKSSWWWYCFFTVVIIIILVFTLVRMFDNYSLTDSVCG